jgi:hypothetical protein
MLAVNEPMRNCFDMLKAVAFGASLKMDIVVPTYIPENLEEAYDLYRIIDLILFAQHS